MRGPGSEVSLTAFGEMADMVEMVEAFEIAQKRQHEPSARHAAIRSAIFAMDVRAQSRKVGLHLRGHNLHFLDPVVSGQSRHKQLAALGDSDQLGCRCGDRRDRASVPRPMGRFMSAYSN